MGNRFFFPFSVYHFISSSSSHYSILPQLYGPPAQSSPELHLMRRTKITLLLLALDQLAWIIIAKGFQVKQNLALAAEWLLAF
jgi:hypothetical protein